MRRIVLAALVPLVFLAASLVTPSKAEAREYPWCARYDWTTYNCGFVNFQQCLTTIQGMGGRCEVNPRYVPEQPRRERPRARQRYQ